MSASAIDVRRLREQDLSAVTQLHMAAFRDSAITALGRGAVRRYYAAQTANVPGAFNLVAVRDDRVVAFCFSGVFGGAMTRFLTRNGPYLLCAVALHPRGWFSPAFRRKIGTGVRLLGRQAARRLRWAPGPARGGAKPARTPRPTFDILAIATDPAHQRCGAAQALMAAATAEAVRRGVPRMMLSVHPENRAAVAFYERLGWQRRMHAGSWQGLMEFKTGVEV